MAYRTQTYLAGDWTGDSDLIQQLKKWNESEHYNLHFSDVHEKIQARDTSLPCTIKRSLADRLNMSKTFIFIVGKQTDSLRQGSCQYCNKYFTYYNTSICLNQHSPDTRSYIEYEYQKAVRDGLRIIVLYNFTTVNKDKCPELLRNIGTHIPAQIYQNGHLYWNYQKIKAVINNVA